MNFTEIDKKLRGIESWDRATNTQVNRFCHHMANKQYGESPLRAAWHWYIDGWKDGGLF